MGERRYTDAEIVRALAARGTEVSAAYFCQLRNGYRLRPSPLIVQALADFFGVLPAYFTDENSDYTTLLQRELAWLVIANDPGVRRVISAVLELRPNARDAIVTAIEQGGRGSDSIGAPIAALWKQGRYKRRRAIPLMQLAVATGIDHDRLRTLLAHGEGVVDGHHRTSVSITDLRRQVQRLDRDVRRLRCAVERVGEFGATPVPSEAEPHSATDAGASRTSRFDYDHASAPS
ncbi:hypothetical protein [Mycolicibacterium sphagni]|uniref:hypothetical protein n=1 Tax=Mycolicibacterium sphagni TaxID=1786 RepID=UPI0021F2606E|nr:hypothetical protein [Mycolicibacterium sphagni]MCV7178679.1 hypothetical protein [Mycolicibacterium sphagni]